MDGVEEDHVLLARLHRARLHRDRQLEAEGEILEKDSESNVAGRTNLANWAGLENPFDASIRFIFGSGRDMAIFRKST